MTFNKIIKFARRYGNTKNFQLSIFCNIIKLAKIFHTNCILSYK